MTRSLAACLVIAALTLGSPPPARAASGDITTYDTIDAIEVVASQITITGIVTGQGSPSTTAYTIAVSDVDAARCDRLALLAASKPGKFQLAMLEQVFNRFACKLIVRTP